VVDLPEPFGPSGETSPAPHFKIDAVHRAGWAAQKVLKPFSQAANGDDGFAGAGG